MKNAVLILMSMVLLSCASLTQQVKKTPQGCIRRPILGINIVQLPDNRIEVTDVAKASPAERAGIRKGDIIISINGYHLDKRIDLLDFVGKNEPGDHVLVTVQRNGNKIDFHVKLGFTDDIQDHWSLLRILWEEKKVNLAILIGEINNVLLKDSLTLEQWRKGAKSSLLVRYENFYINSFRMEKNFSLVDRQKVEEILGELKFGLTGVVSEKVRNKLGEILGVTHLLVIDFYRCEKTGGGFVDTVTRRLIEVETGKVLASIIIVNDTN